MAEDDDPFSIFSDDEDDDNSRGYTGDDQGEKALSAESARIAKSLREQANAKLQTKTTNDITAQNVDEGMIESLEHADLSHLHRLEFHWPTPAYLGPMVLVSDLEVGGGRGYVASRNLQPGTLVLAEEPAMKWPSEQLGRKLDLLSVKHLLEQPNATSLVHDMEVFHPTKENVDSQPEAEENKEQISKMMQLLQSECDDGKVEQLAELAKENGIFSRDGSGLTAKDILRLFLALRYNGLESGVYRHVAMLNHCCHPNCAKFLAPANQLYSEVRTTRNVNAGDSLTISYVPHIMSHASRRKYLWEQHRFDIGAGIKGNDLKTELVGNDLPKSHVHKWEDDSITRRVETTTAELENLLGDTQDDINSGGAGSDTWETLKALEQASIELYQESIQQLKNQSHILLIPILLVHSDTCEQLFKAPTLPTSIQLGILSRQVLSAYRLIPLQISSSGPDHFDLARSHLDLANGIRELLSRSPQKLYELFLPSLTTFQQWSALEDRSRQEHIRIKNLYPHDADRLITNAADS